MGTNYPTALDSIARPDADQTLAAGQHAQRHDDESDAIEAIQAKVGIDGSTNPTSHDKRITDLEGSVGFSGLASDVVFVPTGTVAATNVQTAIAEVASEMIAANIPIADVGNDFTATTVEGALDELQSDAETTAGQLYTHLVGPTAVHAATQISYDHSASGLTADDVQVAIDEVVASFSGSGIPATVVDAASDLIIGTGADAVGRLAKGADNTVLGVSAGSLAYLDPRRLPMTVNAQTGTTYTLALTDIWVTLSNAAAVTATVPTNASVAFPVGTVVNVAQLGVGQVTVAAAGGVTIRTSSSLQLRTQYSGATLIKLGTDEWLLAGDLEPLGQSINAQTGTTYTAVITDAWKMVTLTNASAVTFTVPPNASVAFPIGSHIDFVQGGAGQVTVAPGSGVTVSSTPTLKLRAQYSGATLVKTATNGWYCLGDMAAS